jgi:hypothetical protein
MEVKSDPKQYEEIHYTDIDVAYPGEVRSLTLEDGKDSYLETATMFQVTCASGEIIRFNPKLMHWYSIRPRVHRRPVKQETK